MFPLFWISVDHDNKLLFIVVARNKAISTQFFSASFKRGIYFDKFGKKSDQTMNSYIRRDLLLFLNKNESFPGNKMLHTANQHSEATC